MTAGETYAKLAELRLVVESYSLEPLSGEQTNRTRHTTVIHLHGLGEEGIGEDSTPTEPEQLAFQRAAPTLALAGEWTIDSFSEHLGTLDLFPEPPQDERLRSFRRWGFESAALDLALRQSGHSLAGVLGATARSVTFVNSLRLPEPPTIDPIRERLELVGGLRFKLDPTVDWDGQLIEQIAATGAVEILDFKGQYPAGSPFTGVPDARLYRDLVRAFPDAWLEDPALSRETAEVLEPHRERITWDAPLHSIADIQALDTRPRAINIKPVRFGTLRTLTGVYDYCAANEIAMYSGGFGELGQGRCQLQYLASLFHPDAPNDIAPSAYNLATLEPPLPTSPLAPGPAPTGFRWGDV